MMDEVDWCINTQDYKYRHSENEDVWKEDTNKH